MTDGTYQVCYGSICAGFVIKDGKLLHCAPILRRKFSFFKTIAKRVGPVNYVHQQHDRHYNFKELVP